MAVLAAHQVVVRVAFGSWLTCYNAQAKGWGRALHWPWEAWRLTEPSAGAHWRARRAADPPDQPPLRHVLTAVLLVVAWLAETTVMVWWAVRFYTSAWAG